LKRGVSACGDGECVSERGERSRRHFETAFRTATELGRARRREEIEGEM
jgi:hypothetical protein